MLASDFCSIYSNYFASNLLKSSTYSQHIRIYFKLNVHAGLLYRKMITPSFQSRKSKPASPGSFGTSPCAQDTPRLGTRRCSTDRDGSHHSALWGYRPRWGSSDWCRAWFSSSTDCIGIPPSQNSYRKRRQSPFYGRFVQIQPGPCIQRRN